MCRKRKLGRPAEEFLRHLAHAVHLSAAAPYAAPGPLLEPLASLHAARLKLLDSVQQNVARSGSSSQSGEPRRHRPK